MLRPYPPETLLDLNWPLATECLYPESDDTDHVDISLAPLICDLHGRTLYFCPYTGHIWCDGLQEDGYMDYHQFTAVEYTE